MSTRKIVSKVEISPLEFKIESINSIAGRYKGVRQKSKAPTFAL